MKVKIYAASASLACFLILCGLLSISFSVSANEAKYITLAQANNVSSASNIPATKPVAQLEKATITKNVNTKTLEKVAKDGKASIGQNEAPSNAALKPNDEAASIKKPNGETNLPIPRFVSIKSNEVNVRAGPGDNYPIKWVVIKKELPVEIVQEFEHWRKIRDISGDEGWVHSAMVSGVRSAIILKKTWDIKSDTKQNAKTIATIEQGVVVNVVKCDAYACEIMIDKIDGWLPREALWGVYKNELIED